MPAPVAPGKSMSVYTGSRQPGVDPASGFTQRAPLPTAGAAPPRRPPHGGTCRVRSMKTVCPSMSVASYKQAHCVPIGLGPVLRYRHKGSGARDSWIGAEQRPTQRAATVPGGSDGHWRSVLGKAEVRGKYRAAAAPPQPPPRPPAKRR
eukprot:Rhum_TRINITY_DN22487_c0_g1::Rhum_TRINITY_DN22487_c0_g1_i1::g.175658::m.175658